MLIRGLTDEDFVNYRVPCMFISTSYCTFKCEKESGVRCCQNSGLANTKAVEIDNDLIIKRYLKNNITKAICFGGLEPFDQFSEIFEFIYKLRKHYQCSDVVVIYSGYNKEEIQGKINDLSSLDNIIIKYGRFIPNSKQRFDEILGIKLASDNQYAEKINN